MRTVGVLAAALGTVGMAAACSSGSRALGASGASSTPQAAVSTLLDDLSAHRYGAAVGDLAPGERDAIQQPLPRLIDQLDRLEVLKPGTTLDDFSGISVSFAHPTYQVSVLAPGIDFVRFTGGTVSASVRPSDLPLGSTVTSFTGSLPPGTNRTSQLAGPHAGLVAVEVGQGWYVSLGYSIAEQSLHSQQPGPVPAPSVLPAGDDSADGAVTDFLRSSLILDVRHLLALSPPDELSAARAFAPLYLPRIEAATSALRGFQATVDSVTYADAGQADGTMVMVKSISLSGQFKGTRFSYKNGCGTVSGFTICRDHLGEVLTAGHAPAAAVQLVNLIAGLRPRMGFVAVKEDGKWFVSPTRTLIDDTTAVLASLSPAQLRQGITDVMELRSRG